MQIENEQIIRNNLYILLFIVIVIACLIFLYQRKLIQKERTIQMQEEQLRIYSLQIHENEMQMAQNKVHIMQLSEQLAANEGLHETMMEQQNGLNELKKGMRIYKKKLFYYNRTWRNIHKTCKENSKRN